MTSRKQFCACLIALVLVSFVELSQQAEAKDPVIEGYKFHCVEASGATEASVKKLSNGEDIEKPEQALKCYVQCFFQKLRLMNETGEVQMDALTAYLTKQTNEATAKALITKCYNRRTNPCDTAYDMFICYRKAKPAA